MNNLTAEAYLKPRLEAFVKEAEQAGYARDVVIALLISLLDTDDFSAPITAGQGGAA
ncbi:hypothetical protein AA11825_0062 [Acetobacter pomorum DSM 11825]|uniref:hypothetical protein n=1 Tax=Acetobacter pomorum TaxID=65959 RepID=UPI000B2D867C|nr:hypothetical protein [Acetobacter pomorum]GBR45501.1 hypothetical protein AA11825_0062 [Acetobacter pomorum DSM 11825]